MTSSGINCNLIQRTFDLKSFLIYLILKLRHTDSLSRILKHDLTSPLSDDLVH